MSTISLTSRMRDYCHTYRLVLTFNGLLFTALTFCYAKVFLTLASQWWNNDMYSYGFLIPVISLYLIWVRREKLTHVQPAPRYFDGSIILLLGLFMLLVGHAAAVSMVQELSLIITLIGIVLFLLGKEFLRILWFPITYLLFMIPIWEFITNRLHHPFQLISAALGVKLIQLMGIPAYHDATFIQLPNISLEVAEACSGVNYLIAVMALGIPMSYLFLDKWLARILLVSGAVIIAALSNSLRVGMIGIFYYFHISGNIHGPGHILQGLSVAMVGYVALFAGLGVLTKRFSHQLQPKRTETAPNLTISKPVKWEIYSVGLFITLLLILTGSYLHFYQRTPLIVKSDLKNFPMKIGERVGRESASDFTVYRELGVDQELSRVYQTPSGPEVRLYIGYFEYQEQNKEFISYKTMDLNQESDKVQFRLNKSTLEVNEVIQKKNGQQQLILYWYEINGRSLTNRYLAKAYTAWDALIRGRTNGAVVILSTNLYSDTELPRVLSYNEAFLQEAMPFIQEHLPRV